LAEDKIPIPQFNLYAWPGYELTTKLSTQGIFLNIESCTKFVNQVSVLQNYEADYKDGYNDNEIFEKFNSSNIDNPRITVITEHNSKSYQVDGMTNKVTPETY